MLSVLSDHNPSGVAGKGLSWSNKLVILLWLLVLITWFILSGLNLVNTAFIPTPGDLFSSISSLQFWQLLFLDFGNSISLLFLGLLIGYLLSYLLVLVALSNTIIWQFLTELNLVSRYLPIPVIFPLAILVFGVNDAAKISVISGVTLILYSSYLISLIQKEESAYSLVQSSWNVNLRQRWINFVWPMSNYLNYRVVNQVLMWAISTTIFAEIILAGSKFGIGIRLVQFQNLYQTGSLYGYIIMLVIVAVGLERLLVNFFARTRLDSVKWFTAVLLAVFVLGSVVWQVAKSVSLNSSIAGASDSAGFKILTYRAVANLPLMVYAEKFNSPKINLEFVASGAQALDALQAGRATGAGFSDFPNVLTGYGRNKNLRTVSIVAEKPDQPSLFIFSRKSTSLTDLKDLSDAKVGYFPNNPLVQKGLDTVLFLNGAQTQSLEYLSGNDPLILSQSFMAGKIDLLLTIEPYASQIESETGLKRLNSRETAVKGVQFDALPLASLVLDQSKFTETEMTQFKLGIRKSIDYIRQNTTSDFKPTLELAQIMQKYELNQQSNISYYQTGEEMDPENARLFIKLMRFYGLDVDIDETELNQIYSK
ncbi:MAG: hypothetical protein OHK0017_13100 [Patescibacteria group bacterium]